MRRCLITEFVFSLIAAVLFALVSWVTQVFVELELYLHGLFLVVFAVLVVLLDCWILDLMMVGGVFDYVGFV